MTRASTALLILAVSFARPALSQDREIIPGLAQVIAERVIPPAMKNPRSAEFDRNSVVVDELVDWIPGTTTFKVRGVVRGTNSFNATVPHRWTAYVLHVDGKDTVSLVMLEDQVVHVGTRGADVAKQLAADKAAAEQMTRDAKAAAKARDDEVFEAERERRMEQGRRDAEQRRIEGIRSKGKRAGEDMANRMGVAVSRLDPKEAERRGRREARRLKVPPDDVEHFVLGYVAGAMAARTAGAPK